MNKNKNEILKLIAAISMLVDHVGVLFFPDVIMMRIIGRLAFPIFAYYIAQGFINTSNINKYILRIFIFSIISQVPFCFFAYIIIGNYLYFNVLFTFLLALILLYAVENKQYIIGICIAFIPITLEMFMSIDTDYGTYGIIMVLIFYLFREKTIIRNIAIVALTIIHSYLIGIPFYYSVQIYCVLALPIIDHVKKPRIVLPKYFFYIFYPLHIGTLVVIYYVGMI